MDELAPRAASPARPVHGSENELAPRAASARPVHGFENELAPRAAPARPVTGLENVDLVAPRQSPPPLHGLRGRTTMHRAPVREEVGELKFPPGLEVSLDGGVAAAPAPGTDSCAEGVAAGVPAAGPTAGVPAVMPCLIAQDLA